MRAPTNRPNIRYHVLHVEESIKPINKVAIDIANVLESRFTSPSSRGIIFVDSINDANLIGHAFNDCISHGQMGNAQRLQNQKDWFCSDGNRKWIVATTGFIHGIDYPKVEAVIVCGLAYGFINLAQAFGRAGRLGQPVIAIDLIDGSTWHHSSDTDYECREKALDWTKNTTLCRRQGLSIFFDGKLATCQRLPKAELCDICDPNNELLQLLRPLLSQAPEVNNMDPYNSKPQHTPQTEPSNLILQHQIPCHLPVQHSVPFPQQSSISASTTAPNNLVTRPVGPGPSMAVQLDSSIVASHGASKAAKAKILTHICFQLLGKCVVCWAWKGKFVEQEKNHKPYYSCCPNPVEQVYWASGFTEFSKKLRFTKYEYCFYCGLPQGTYQPSNHPTFQNGRQLDCPFRQFVHMAIWQIFHTVPTMVNARKAFPALQNVIDASQFSDWAVKEEYGEFYNGLELLIWFWNTRSKDRDLERYI